MSVTVDVKAMQQQVTALVDDLRHQAPADPTLMEELHQEYAGAKDDGRVGVTFETWLEDRLDQAAVAWVLGCVFIRFCEDNGLVKPLWLGGADPQAPAEQAAQHRQAYLIKNPQHNDRHWLREAFGYLGELRATGRIFDKHSLVWRFHPSGQAAEALSDFFRRGAGAATLRARGLDTRFLGDLYQDLSTHARSTYALLQTPAFVEEFILDRTLTPAISEFGLAGTSVIDPTCGSGHFLLGAFRRLYDLWRDREPAGDVRVLVERALAQVTGVDVNPFAVAIARFRLMVAALSVCGLSSLERAPTFSLRVATGDSLLGWGEQSSHQGDMLPLLAGRSAFAYVTEDDDLLREFLVEGTYTVVVGNPPYITVKDKALNERYRKRYSDVCSGKYALSVPFAKRFFALARRGDHDGDGAGCVGQITSNSFMKREFGKKLINVYFAGQVDLAEVIDTSGAYIPGHGTPTAILVGRNRLVSLRYSGRIRTILGVRGEPSQPNVPAKGYVWSAILDQIDHPGSESDWITSTDSSRDQLEHHPWSLSGGGAGPLMVSITRAGTGGTLGGLAALTGFVAITAEDDAFFLTASAVRRHGIESTRPMVTGDVVRDYSVNHEIECVFPYGDDLVVADVGEVSKTLKFAWQNRRVLQRRKRFGTFIERIPSLRWYEFGELYREKLRTPMSIAFAFVATHNHFVLDRGGKVFKQSAPVIKLPEGASEDDHLRLLGVLNSSTACFWLKQVSHDKGIRGEGGGFTSDDWERFYEFTGTKVQEFPLPDVYPLGRARELDSLAARLTGASPAAVVAAGAPTRVRLAEARAEQEVTRARMIAVQEELDWEVYRLYGLLAEELTMADPPPIKLGERAFEIVLARRCAAGEADTQWFARHGSTPITEIPEHWPPAYQEIVARRIAVIEGDRNIGLIERPECKRRWATDGWDKMQTAALRDWLLERLDAPGVWGTPPVPLSVAQLADRVRHDEAFRAALDLWVGSDQHDLARTLDTLLADEHVPYLPADRYKATGLRKRAQWERTWALQRLEDAGEDVGTIAVPPKYTSADFVKPSFWRARGKLDVPKERFISYPKVGRDGDGSLLLGWAGWDHLAQAQALATVYLDRKTQAAWPAERLLPLLAGLAELEPWLRQWHAEPRAGYPGTPADFFTGLIDTELAQLGADRSRLRELRGVEDLPVHSARS